MGKKAVAKEPKKAPANKAVAKVQKTPKETVTGKKEPLKKKQKKERKTEKRETLQDKWNMSGGYELKVKCDPKAIIAALITDKVKGVAETDVTNWLGTTFLHFKSPEAAKKACQQCAEINVWCDSKVKVKQGREPTVAVARPQNGVRALTSFLGRYYSKVIGETDIFAVRAVHENSVLYKFPSKAAADKAVKAGPIKDFNNLVVQAVRGDIGADDKVLLNTEGCFLCYVPHFTRSKK
jgi:hypothetical protein|uniref:Uncharacterized protein n=1 Tax=Eutreptiella gymnastica TaxID=73025 RepID=A0A7S4FNB6_9EUGL